jgi:hypothetical protein
MPSSAMLRSRLGGRTATCGGRRGAGSAVSSTSPGLGMSQQGLALDPTQVERRTACRQRPSLPRQATGLLQLTGIA